MRSMTTCAMSSVGLNAYGDVAYREAGRLEWGLHAG